VGGNPEPAIDEEAASAALACFDQDFEPFVRHRLRWEKPGSMVFVRAWRVILMGLDLTICIKDAY